MEELPKPSDAAQLHIIVKRDDGPDGREGGEAWTGNPVFGWLRWLIPATAEARVTVPGTRPGCSGCLSAPRSRSRGRQQ